MNDEYAAMYRFVKDTEVRREIVEPTVAIPVRIPPRSRQKIEIPRPKSVSINVADPWKIVLINGKKVFRGYVSVVCPANHRHLYSAVDWAGPWCKTCQVLERMGPKFGAIVADFSAVYGDFVVCSDELSAEMMEVGICRRKSVSFCTKNGAVFLHIDCKKYARWPDGRPAVNLYADTKKKNVVLMTGSRDVGRGLSLFS